MVQECSEGKDADSTRETAASGRQLQGGGSGGRYSAMTQKHVPESIYWGVPSSINYQQ